jgi:hypothetical protein
MFAVMVTASTRRPWWCSGALAMSTSQSVNRNRKSSGSAAAPIGAKGAGRRVFRYVPYGESAPLDDPVTISCDGRVPGSTLEVSHWTGNGTPDELYADTSTEMAIKLARAEAEGAYPELAEAVVINNHYDTDGVLSVYACTAPVPLEESVLRHERLLVEGAEAGDFGEWSSDAGVKLDCAVTALEDSDEEAAYERALALLPDLLSDLASDDSNGGSSSSFESLWRLGFEEALAGYQDIQEGRARLSKGPGKMALLEERPNSRMSPYALHRGLVESGLWKDTSRVLRVDRDDRGRHRYEYEKIGHGWVSKLMDRPAVMDADGSSLAQLMGNEWSSGGRSGLVSICKSSYISASPEEVSSKLWRHDAGCQ